jgi:hypothetical protein
MIKDELCEAFCGELEVRNVPAGLAVRTGFYAGDGDAIGFYITRHPEQEYYSRLEDSGLIIPALEAAGINLESGVRAEAFKKLLKEYHAEFDEDTLELHSGYVSQNDVPAEAMRFIALLLRVRDLELLSQETVKNAWSEDAEAALKRYFENKASIEFRVPVSPELPDFIADAVIRPRFGDSVAVYFATSDSKVDEAVMLWMEKRWAKRNLKVVALLEKERPPQIGARALRRALNRLDATTSFRGDEMGALMKIGDLAGATDNYLSLGIGPPLLN